MSDVFITFYPSFYTFVKGYMMGRIDAFQYTPEALRSTAEAQSRSKLDESYAASASKPMVEHRTSSLVARYKVFPFQALSLSLLSTSKGYSHSCQQVIIHVEWCLRLLLSPASASASGPSRVRKKKQTKYTQSSSSRR